MWWFWWNITILAAAAKSLQLCPTLCDPIDGSLPGSSIPGILQARTLEWVAIPFSSAWKWKVKVKMLSRIWPSETPWTAAFLHPWDFPGKSTRVGCHCLLWVTILRGSNIVCKQYCIIYNCSTVVYNWNDNYTLKDSVTRWNERGRMVN